MNSFLLSSFTAAALFLSANASAREQFLFRVPEHDPGVAHASDPRNYSPTECRITLEKKVLCENFYQAPKELNNVTALGMSDSMACAIRAKQVVCWGGYGDKLIQTQLKNPEKIAVGRQIACAIDQGEVQCWTFERWDDHHRHRETLFNFTKVFPDSSDVAIVDNPSSDVSSVCALNKDGLNCAELAYRDSTQRINILRLSHTDNAELGVKISKFFAEAYDSSSQKAFYLIDETSSRAFRLTESGYLASACLDTRDSPCVPASFVSSYGWDASLIRSESFDNGGFYPGNPHSRSNAFEFPDGAKAYLTTADIVGAAYKDGIFSYAPPARESLSGVRYSEVELFKAADWGTSFHVNSKLESEGTLDVSVQYLNPGNRNWTMREEYRLRLKPKEKVNGFVKN